MTETTEVKEDVKLSKGAQTILDSVEKLTVLELSDLVKAMEDKFGVVAAAPVAVAAASAGDDSGEGDSGPSTVSVVLTGAGDKKIQVLKAVRELTGLGLKEAKELVDGVPSPIKEGIEKEEADKIKKELEEQGATVEIK
jgi:large subunit ribosomal protein L7/L12